jgi:hypothetical protein
VLDVLREPGHGVDEHRDAVAVLGQLVREPVQQRGFADDQRPPAPGGHDDHEPVARRDAERLPVRAAGRRAEHEAVEAEVSREHDAAPAGPAQVVAVGGQQHRRAVTPGNGRALVAGERCDPPPTARAGDHEDRDPVPPDVAPRRGDDQVERAGARPVPVHRGHADVPQEAVDAVGPDRRHLGEHDPQPGIRPEEFDDVEQPLTAADGADRHENASRGPPGPVCPGSAHQTPLLFVNHPLPPFRVMEFGHSDKGWRDGVDSRAATRWTLLLSPSASLHHRPMGVVGSRG